MEYCYIVPKDDELMHYGVKGMHWGIRRYQPYKTVPRKSGKGGVYKPTTKAGKAALWKARESERQAGRYDRKSEVIDNYISKKQEKLKEARKEGASAKKIAKLEKKIDYGKTEKRINEKLKNAELKKIKSMDINDVSKARLRKGAYYTGQVLKSAAVKAATMAAVGTALDSFVKSPDMMRRSLEASAKAGGYRDAAAPISYKATDAFVAAQGARTHSGYMNAMTKYHSLRSQAAPLERLAKQNVKLAVYLRNGSRLMKGLGFAASATAVGSAALNLTKIGRINEYSNLKGYERKSIVKKEKEAYKKRWK